MDSDSYHLLQLMIVIIFSLKAYRHTAIPEDCHHSNLIHSLKKPSLVPMECNTSCKYHYWNKWDILYISFLKKIKTDEGPGEDHFGEKVKILLCPLPFVDNFILDSFI